MVVISGTIQTYRVVTDQRICSLFLRIQVHFRPPSPVGWAATRLYLRNSNHSYYVWETWAWKKADKSEAVSDCRPFRQDIGARLYRLHTRPWSKAASIFELREIRKWSHDSNASYRSDRQHNGHRMKRWFFSCTETLVGCTQLLPFTIRSTLNCRFCTKLTSKLRKMSEVTVLFKWLSFSSIDPIVNWNTKTEMLQTAIIPKRKFL